MSDSETAPQGGAATTAEPAAPADAETAAPPETGTETTEQEPAPAKPNHDARRWAKLSASYAASEQERARLAAEVEHYRRQTAPQPAEPPLTPEQQAVVAREVTRQREVEREAERSESFHTAGRAAYPDWSERCQSLMQMGADSQFAQLLIETPDGAKVAGALADDPEALEAITGLRTERARAIALGRYAAALETRPAATRTTRAPAPIRPISGASARVEVNESTMTAQQLVDHYSKQERQRRGLS